jgi:hypothetical protein
LKHHSLSLNASSGFYISIISFNCNALTPHQLLRTILNLPEF